MWMLVAAVLLVTAVVKYQMILQVLFPEQPEDAPLVSSDRIDSGVVRVMADRLVRRARCENLDGGPRVARAGRRHPRKTSVTVLNSFYFLGVGLTPLQVSVLKSRWTEKNVRNEINRLVLDKWRWLAPGGLDVQGDWALSGPDDLNAELLEMLPELGELEGPVIVMFALDTPRDAASRTMLAPPLRRRKGAVKPSPAAASAPTGWVVDISRNGTPEGFLPVPAVAVVGRAAGCDLRLEDADKKVSRQHARVDANGKLQVTDLGSTNGTIVAGSRLASNQPVEVPHGGIVCIGPYDLTFRHVQDPDDTSAADEDTEGDEDTAGDGYGG